MPYALMFLYLKEATIRIQYPSMKNNKKQSFPFSNKNTAQLTAQNVRIKKQ